TELLFVDLTNATFADFGKALEQIRDPLAESMIKLTLNKTQFFENRMTVSGAISAFHKGKHFMPDLPLKLFTDLRAIGVNLDTVELAELTDGVVRINFSWEYYGSSVVKRRSLMFIVADITDPTTYPSLLQTKLSEG